MAHVSPPNLSHPLILRDPGASPLTLLGMGGIPLGGADSPWLGGAQPPVPVLPPAPVLHPALAEAQRMTQTQGQAKQARGPSSPPCPRALPSLQGQPCPRRFPTMVSCSSASLGTVSAGCIATAPFSRAERAPRHGAAWGEPIGVTKCPLAGFCSPQPSLCQHERGAFGRSPWVFFCCRCISAACSGVHGGCKGPAEGWVEA